MKRRGEVVNFLNNEFKVSDYKLPERNSIYALLFSLFPGDLTKIKPTIAKLLNAEKEPQAKEHLALIMAFTTKHVGPLRHQESGLLLYRSIAESGQPEAQFLMGLAYENGWGVAKDFPIAQEWYKKAAIQGHSKAQAALKRVKCR
jgi:TPR repeat protein